MEHNLKSIGSRMAVARHILGKTTAELAVLLGVGADTYRRMESGHVNLAKYLDAIADALSVSKDYLLKGPIELVPAGALSYRRKVALKSPQARHIQGMASLTAEFTSLIEEYVNLPTVSVPSVPLSSQEEIEELVADLRRKLQMSDAPLRNAVALVESMGVLVFWVEADREFDGVSFWRAGRPYILLNKHQLDGYRTRFTVLHELCHLICHRTSEDVDRHEEERKRLDREADLFASAFLLPASSFARRFPRFGSLYDILDDRSYWKASCAAMIRRARQLNLIDEDRYRRLNVSISAKGWRRGEPNAAPPETSRIHQFFLDEAGESGLTTIKLVDQLAYSPSWFSEAFPEAAQYQLAFSLDSF